MDKFIKEYGIKKSRNQAKKQVSRAIDEVIEQKWEDAAAVDEWLQQEEDWAFSNMSQEWELYKNPVSEWDNN